MKPELLKPFQLFRDIFGVCPECGVLFRLSECHIYLKTRPPGDWMDKLEVEERKVEMAEERLGDDEAKMREAMYDKWRRKSQRLVARMDPVFPPKKLTADDAKAISHPVDFIVFKGMNSGDRIKDLIFLDSTAKSGPLQKSVEKTIEKDHYDWATMRILENGTIKEE